MRLNKGPRCCLHVAEVDYCTQVYNGQQFANKDSSQIPLQFQTPQG